MTGLVVALRVPPPTNSNPAAPLLLVAEAAALFAAPDADAELASLLPPSPPGAELRRICNWLTGAANVAGLARDCDEAALEERGNAEEPLSAADELPDLFIGKHQKGRKWGTTLKDHHIRERG